jgi:hypothetical protein
MLEFVKVKLVPVAIQTLQRVGGGKEDGEYGRRLVWGRYLEETQGGHELAGLFSGGKTIGVQPQSS